MDKLDTIPTDGSEFVVWIPYSGYFLARFDDGVRVRINKPIETGLRGVTTHNITWIRPYHGFEPTY